MKKSKILKLCSAVRKHVVIDTTIHRNPEEII